MQFLLLILLLLMVFKTSFTILNRYNSVYNTFLLTLIFYYYKRFENKIQQFFKKSKAGFPKLFFKSPPLESLKKNCPLRLFFDLNLRFATLPGNLKNLEFDSLDKKKTIKTWNLRKSEIFNNF